MSEAANEKELLASVFKRRGANGRFTRLFDDLEETQKETLWLQAELSGDELAIIGSVEGPNQWLILTTRKLAWCRGGSKTVLPVEDIVDAVADLHALQQSGPTKAEMRQLQIITKDGQQAIEVESGAPLSGVWNVLKGIGTANRQRNRPKVGTSTDPSGK